MLRSAKSLMTQPAARITTTPSTNTTSTFGFGCPAPAIHSAHSAGHRRSQVPTGRSSRMRRPYWVRRRPSRQENGASGKRGGAAGAGSGAGSSGAAADMGSGMLADAPVTLVAADPAQCQGGAADGIGLEPLGRRLHARQEVRVAHQIRDAQLREPGLARAEELARAAQLEVAARDLEAVRGGADRLQPRARRLRKRRAVEEYAAARREAA